MADTFITDMTHFLDEYGEVPDLPTRVLNLVLHQGAIVEWMTAIRPQGFEWTNVYCRRSPGRKRCGGQIIARLDSDSNEISWECLYCGDGGFIYGWANTVWDRTKREAVDIALRRLVEKGTLYKAIRQLRGQIEWEGDVGAWRSSRSS